eukprot:TRINITY_DN8453_c0_g1_i1.p1 TRINITY_DN8453_c0_g1~~TRINITY_DN8453_c0_g1_i1.p1  ORF type:complete len:400 (-),score=67.57 TRINITY_DN8453_c0_g1_i1:526-1725(-)
MGRNDKTPGWLVVCFVAGMLLTGTLNTLTTKILFTLSTMGINGESEVFRKPWFGTWNMLFAMSLVLATEKLIACLCRRSGNKGRGLLEPEDTLGGHTKTYRQKIFLVAIPAACDLLATAFACIGIMYIPASVWQMLRGATIIFAAIASIIFLGRKLLCFNWLGLFLCVVGVTTVGLANMSSAADSGGSTKDSASLAFGMTLTLLAQVVQALQVIAEEFLMKDVDLPAAEIIGWEGIWGCLMMIFIVYPMLWILPGDDHGHMEDVQDTLVAVSNSSQVICVVALYLVSCGTFNITGIAVTGALSGVHRMMLDASRTMVIWSFGLFVHYRVDKHSPFGEVWTSNSYIQLVGFFVLVTGQAVYGEVLRVPGLWYPPSQDLEMDAMISPSAALHMASPLPREG